MDHTPAGIESELLDLSSFDVATLRSIDEASISTYIDRVRAKITDSDVAVTGYNGNFSEQMRPTEPESEDRAG